MRLSINQKMTAMGLFIFLSLACLLAVSRHEAGIIKSAREQSRTYEEDLKRRMRQLIDINQYEYHLGQLALLAKAVMINRDEGRVSDARLEGIDAHSVYILEHAAAVRKMAGDGKTAPQAARLAPAASELTARIQTDLVSMVGKNGQKERENVVAFEKLYDLIKKKGERIDDNLIIVEQELSILLANALRESRGVLPAAAAKFNVARVQKWLAEIGAARAMDGFDYGFDEAAYAAERFYENVAEIEKVAPFLQHVLATVRSFFAIYYDKATAMAGAYVEKGPAGGNPLLGETDALAEDILGKLESVIQRIEFARDMSLKMESGINQVKQVRQAHFEMMLAVMEALIDRDAGVVSPERLDVIQRASETVAYNLSTLAALLDTAAGEAAIRSCMEEYDILFISVQDVLKDLIERRGTEIREITAQFDRIEADIAEKTADVGKILQDVRAEAIRNVRLSEDNLVRIESRLASRLKRQTFISTAAFALICGVILLTFIRFAGSVTGSLRATVRDLRTAAGRIASAAGEISRSSQTLASGSSEQAAAIQETSATLEEMTDMGRRTARLTDGVEVLMKENIEKSGTSLKSLIDLTRKMTKIEADSDQISHIVKTIDEIAFQTNLLALNAAVEAARAGESGTGFAVVADEVRNLAIRAAESAENTQNLLDGVVRDIKESAGAIKSVNADFDGIIESATVIGEKTASITRASADVAAGIQQIGRAIGEIDDVTQQTVATAEQSAAASEQLNAQAEEMNRQVDLMNALIYGGKGKGRARRAGKRREKKEEPKQLPETT